MITPETPASLVRDLVARADRRFRARHALRALARVAPVAAAVILALAAAARWLGWSPIVPLGALAGVLAGLAGYFLLARRPRAVSDAIAARVDADAAMSGELRSAHWFAAAPASDDWTVFHVQRAAEHAQRVDWAALYPPVRARGSWAVAATCAIAAVALTVSLPARSRRADSVVVDGVEVDAQKLPEALRKKLEALMLAMEEGKANAAEANATLEQLKDLMANVDPALQKKLEEMLKNRPLGADAETRRKDLDAEDLAERGEKPDSNGGLPEDVRWALEDLAARLANSSNDRKTNEGNPSASSETGEKGLGSQQAQAEMSAQASMQMVKEAASDPGASQMMMGGGAMGGDSRPGAGGNNGAETGAADALLIAKALRKELVEAAADIKGENVTKEDIRRKTEQGKSTLGFTRAAPPAAFDRSRADAPPAVPEGRRDLLQRYFIRR